MQQLRAVKNLSKVNQNDEFHFRPCSILISILDRVHFRPSPFWTGSKWIVERNVLNLLLSSKLVVKYNPFQTRSKMDSVNFNPIKGAFS
jgi:hypothetical protein